MPEAAGMAKILASCGIVSSYCWAKQLYPPENPETKKSTVPAQSSKPTGKSGYPIFTIVNLDAIHFYWNPGWFNWRWRFLPFQRKIPLRLMT
jgi:hypothetical protein